MIDFKPIQLEVKDKYRSLDVEAKGVVKGTKYFPVFLVGGEEYIFKPISKTKPYATTLFSYAEVYWSYIINKYFDNKTPICRLAYCKGLSEEQPKYYDKGVLVKSTIKDNQKLINILEYFEAYPDSKVDIKDYVNYCMEFYNYCDILDSDFIKNNHEFGEDLAFQILLSILRQDYNYHYENINFIVQDGNIISINPPIDFEFSCMFCFPDKKGIQGRFYDDYLWQTRIRTKAQIAIANFLNNPSMVKSDSLDNVSKIVLDYPEVVKKFLNMLEAFIREVDDIDISDESEFIGKLDSDAWEIGYYTYKENNPEKLEEALKKVNLKEINKDEVFARIKEQVKENALQLEKTLKIYMYARSYGVSNLRDFTLDDLSQLLAKNNDRETLELKRVL